MRHGWQAMDLLLMPQRPEGERDAWAALAVGLLWLAYALAWFWLAGWALQWLAWPVAGGSGQVRDVLLWFQNGLQTPIR